MDKIWELFDLATKQSSLKEYLILYSGCLFLGQNKLNQLASEIDSLETFFQNV